MARLRWAWAASALAVVSSFDVYEYAKCQLCEVRSFGPCLSSGTSCFVGCVAAAFLSALCFVNAVISLLMYIHLQNAKPSGAIDDCCCDVETVDQVNTRHFLPILHDLTKR